MLYVADRGLRASPGSPAAVGTGYRTRASPTSPAGHRLLRFPPLSPDPRRHLLGRLGHGRVDRLADPPGLQSLSPLARRRAHAPPLQPVPGPPTAGPGAGAAVVRAGRAPGGHPP